MLIYVDEQVSQSHNHIPRDLTLDGGRLPLRNKQDTLQDSWHMVYPWFCSCWDRTSPLLGRGCRRSMWLGGLSRHAWRTVGQWAGPCDILQETSWVHWTWSLKHGNIDFTPNFLSCTASIQVNYNFEKRKKNYNIYLLDYRSVTRHIDYKSSYS